MESDGIKNIVVAGSRTFPGQPLRRTLVLFVQYATSAFTYEYHDYCRHFSCVTKSSGGSPLLNKESTVQECDATAAKTKWQMPGL